MATTRGPHDTPEHRRLEESRTGAVAWKAWGPHLSERQWETVREDYSRGGDAWSYFSHDQAHSRAYRWGEDGIAGVCDERQRLCLALALWNGADPILKERMFGLTNAEGNHGEDVKQWACTRRPMSSRVPGPLSIGRPSRWSATGREGGRGRPRALPPNPREMRAVTG
jgi:hypothetical protein